MKRIIFLLVFLLPVLAYAQFTGRVVNGNNEGVPFASVIVKNTTIGVTTDSTGRFTIPGIQKFPFTLVISYTGFESQERIIRNSNTDNILIQLESLFQRDTVVITSRRRRDQVRSWLPEKH